jgi:hypothetical protein
MASLQEIYRELIAINDVEFQQLCDEYLFLSHGYPALNRTGSQKLKRKSKKGTPDAWWLQPSGQYVFAEYTTKAKTDNKKAFLQKLKEDVRKCIDEKITGIPTSQIQTIILCFNSEILPRETEALKKMLNRFKIQLAPPISLDVLALNIYSRYPHLALKYLGLHIDTGQVLLPQQFIDEYAGSGLSTPLSNTFLHREEELKQLSRDIDAFEITILTGAPGVGKSKLALEAMAEWKKANSNYGLFCISNKDETIAYDLNSHVLLGKDYLVFVDDANRQSQHLRSILHLLKSRKPGRLKLLITVRDYALEFVKRSCSDFHYIVQNIQPLSDKHLEEILATKDFSITNPIWIKRILEIAKGNPRIAIMAAKLALKNKRLGDLFDLFEFYDLYFTSFIKDYGALNNMAIQQALGLLSFFYSIDTSFKSAFRDLLTVFGLDYYNIMEAFTALERMELAEISSDHTIYRISDQVLSNYFFYKVFIKDRTLDFSKLLYHYFDAHRHRFTDNLVPAQRDFGYKKVIPPIEPTIIQYFDSIAGNDEKAYQFLDTLWFCIPEHTISFLSEKISALDTPIDPVFVANTKNKNQTSTTDQKLKIIERFFFQSEDLLISGLELAFEYVSKVPKQYDQLYRTLSAFFVFSFEDEVYNFHRQEQFVNFLIKNTSKSHPIYIRAFFDLFPELTKTVFNVQGTTWKKNSFSLYTYRLPLKPSVKKIRKNLWQHALKHFSSERLASEEIIFDYIKPKQEVKDVLEFDVPFVLTFIDNFFDPGTFIHCYYIQQLLVRYKRLGIEHASFDTLKEKSYSDEYKLYRLIEQRWLRNKEEHEYETVDFEKFNRLKTIEVKYKLQLTSFQQFEDFYRTFLVIAREPHMENRNFHFSLSIIIQEMFLLNPELAFQCLQHIQNTGNHTGFIPYKTIGEVTQNNHGYIYSLFQTIMANSYKAKYEWIFAFCCLLPDEKITQQHYEALMKAYTEITEYTYLDFRNLHKYLEFNKNIFADVLKIFVSKAEAGIQVELYHHFFEEYAGYFVDDLEILKQAYYTAEKTQQHFDYEGKSLLELLKLDETFFGEYVQYHTKQHYYLSIREYDHLSIVWNLENAEQLVRQQLDFLTKEKYFFAREDFANAFFKDLEPANKISALAFLRSYMKANKKDLIRINTVLNVFRSSFNDQFFPAIGEYLKINNSIADFKKLDLLNNGFTITSAKTIWPEVRATQLGNILQYINSVPGSSKYAHQKAYLKTRISDENRWAEIERRDNFMREDW